MSPNLSETVMKGFKPDSVPIYAALVKEFAVLIGHTANDDHPSHDVAHGQMLVKEVYEALRASPHGMKLFIITYDEHGGFFDHVKTPFVNIPNPDGNTDLLPISSSLIG
ncbi:hypothetical protein JHK87_010660 [Glycine soja]|nr:hypothetical protein JHK87_010660 [Glycine soja]